MICFTSRTEQATEEPGERLLRVQIVGLGVAALPRNGDLLADFELLRVPPEHHQREGGLLGVRQRNSGRGLRRLLEGDLLVTFS